MQFLPIVERELRVAARHSRTWWRRILTLLLGLIILAFTWATASRWTTFGQIGHMVFQTLTVFGFIYALFAGPLATTDCLSRERREGTLGLLFLTDLRGYDVVFGKLAASSLDVALGLLAALPLLALPVLAGGINLTQFACVVLMLFNVMVLSLAIGVFSSSMLASNRASLSLTFIILLFLTLGLPFVGDQILRIGNRSSVSGFFYMCCPLWGLVLSLNNSGLGSPITKYWLNIAGTQGLAWVLLGVACIRTGRYWRELPESKLARWWRERGERGKRHRARRSLQRRRTSLGQNPVAWLEGRDRLQENALALLVGAAALFCVIQHSRSPRTWSPGDWFVIWPTLSHYSLCLWIAIQAPRRFADDRQSGALELLLCTPLPSRTIVKGTMAVLWRRFGKPLIGMVLLDAYVVDAYVGQHGGWLREPGRSLILLCQCAALVFPLQGYAFARVGLYQGLAKASSLRATFTLVWGLGVLPWALFIGFVLFCDLGRPFLFFLPRITQPLACLSWAGAHLVVFAVFLSRASWELRHNFRELASGDAIPWWKRAWDGLTEDFR